MYESVPIEQPALNVYGVWFSDNFELDRIVPFETTENFLMTEALSRIIPYKNNLIILDSDFLTSFSYLVDNK
jgi:hypothetical protein